MGRGRWLRLHWDRTLAWVLVTIGVLALALGWAGLSGTPFPAEQMSYLLSGGVIGGVLVLFGAGLLISADLRDEWHKLDRIEAELRRQNGDGAGDRGEKPGRGAAVADQTSDVCEVAATADGLEPVGAGRAGAKRVERRRATTGRAGV